MKYLLSVPAPAEHWNFVNEEPGPRESVAHVVDPAASHTLPHPRVMTTLRMVCPPLVATAMLAATAVPPETLPPLHAEIGRCTLVPGRTLALLRVEQDTTLPFAPAGSEAMSMSGVRDGASSARLATQTTAMPAARVRLLKVDSTTRVIFAAHGITDSQPIAFIRAAPYGADCRTIGWTDRVPFVERGEVAYVRATLAPRERWIDGLPVLVIPDVWNYPYPRRRGLAFGVAPDAPLAPADAMFSLNAALELSQPGSVEERLHMDSVRRTRAIAWARDNPAPAELEPVRTLVRRAVLDPDWEVAERFPSRLRGSYRVDLEVGGERSTWFFRSHDQPGYRWHGGDSLQRTADLLASPHVSGYRLVGYAAGSPDSLPGASPRDTRRVPLVWLSTNDRPTAPGNDARRALSGVLEFNLDAASERLWNDLEALVPRQSAMDSAMLAGLNRPIPRGRKQPQIPLTLRLDTRGAIRADTTLVVGGRALRVVLARVDTHSIRRPF